MKNRHAYMIMAHGDFETLKYLLRAIDDERNDIFLHIDKKTKQVPLEELRDCVNKSQLIVVPRMKIYWGHSSIVACELKMLEMAISKEHYHYYHLLSGNDFPLKSQDEIHRILDNDCLEHINCVSEEDADSSYIYKVKYYFPFFKWTGRGLNSKYKFLNDLVSRIGHKEWQSQELQEKIGIDRTKKYKDFNFYKGDQWFSITDDFARYLVAHKKKILKIFTFTNGPDELFIPTFAMNSSFAEKIYRTEDGSMDNLRQIDWKRGDPYEYRIEDLEELKNSNKIFARKVSYNSDSKLVESLYRYIEITHNKGASFEQV